MITSETKSKLLALLAIGICDGLRENKIEIRDAEILLFSPRSMQQAKNCDQRVVELIHMGTELDDIKDLVPDEFDPTLDRIKNLAFSCLEDLKNGPIADPNQHPWIDLIS